MSPLNTRTLTLVAAAALLAGCSMMKSTPAPAPKPVLVDGQQPIPADYKSWPKFLSNIQRPDAKQVREIYQNTAAAKAVRGQPIPQGAIYVMENYAAVANEDGSLQKGPDGNLVKGKLLAVFLMEKNEGWGQAVEEPLRTGNWIYTAYTGAGDKSPVDLNTCRACHIPLGAGKDWVHRYDQYFDQKKSALPAHEVLASLNAGQAAISAQDLRTVGSLR